MKIVYMKQIPDTELVVFLLFLALLLSSSMSGGPLSLVVAAGGSYLLASTYLLRNPLRRMKKRRPMPPSVLIAHRGGAGEGYENTLLTFRKAVDTGAQMLELDVHLCKDGQVVVAHDANLQRLAGEDVSVMELGYDCLPVIKEKISIDFCPGAHFTDTSVSEEDRRLAKLEEVLVSFPDTQINIDLKSGTRELAQKVNSLLVKHGAVERCVWGNSQTTEYCYSLNPDTGLFFSMPRVFRLYLYFYTGLLPFIRLPETHLEIPMPSTFLDPRYKTPDGNVGLARLPRAILKLADWFLMSPILFRHLKSRGIHVYLWVLNSEDEYQKAFEVGASGIMTDFPSKLAQYLK